MKTQVKRFFKRYESGGRIWNTYAGFVCVRFSHSFVIDLLWWAGLPRQIAAILLLSLLLWAAWIYRPWVETGEEFQGG